MGPKMNDMITSVVTCADGSCLCKVVDEFVFLIESTANSSSWKEQSAKDIEEACGIDASSIQVYKWFKVIVPFNNTMTYATSIIFNIQIPSDRKQKCKLGPGLVWINANEMRIHNEKRRITNPTILDFFPKLTSIKYDTLKDQFHLTGIIVEVSPSSLVVKSSTPSEVLIQKSSVMQVQKALFRDFYTACQPAVLMSRYQFMTFMQKFGIANNLLAQLFRAVDFNNNGFLTYRDIAKIIAAIDPSTEHSGNAADLRKHILFRMFDTDKDLALNRQELGALIEYIRLPNDPDVRTCVDNVNRGDRFQLSKKLSFEEFAKNIDYMRNSVKQSLRATRNCVNLYGKSVAQPTELARVSVDFAARYRKELETRKKYMISSHTICIARSGNAINVEKVWALKHASSFETLRAAGITKDLRKLSCELNSPHTTYNEQITNLRYLAYVNKIRSGNRVASLDRFNWGNVIASRFGQNLLYICTTTRKIVRTESRLLELKSPIYVLGSVHGNFGDLLALERVLWPRGPGHSLGSLLFLGGYVDTIHYGIEVVTFLFSYKNLFPTKVFLLRGSHEMRKIQIKDCFQRECCTKFGENLGMNVWEAINSVFDCLPVAAVIDHKILCVHSGIPQPLVCSLTQFYNNIPSILPNPEKLSQLAWELFWNEPATKADMSQAFVDGFAKNNRRGTGYIFNQDALLKFLDTNFYSHLIRTNNPVLSGFTISNKGRLVTVFTSSRYNNSNNNSSCLLVDKGIIRGVCLNTDDD